MQQQQPALSTQDFNMAADIDPQNADVYHHRGQVRIIRDFCPSIQIFQCILKEYKELKMPIGTGCVYTQSVLFMVEKVEVLIWNCCIQICRLRSGRSS